VHEGLLDHRPFQDRRDDLEQRVQLNAAGQVELKLKTPWRDGTTHLVMSPLEFMQWLAVLVPRTRLRPSRTASQDVSLENRKPGLGT